MNRWELQPEIREKYLPILTEYFNRLERLSVDEVEHMENEEFELDLFNSGLAPFTLKELLVDEFGYEEVNSSDCGWELNLTVDLIRTDGKTFESTCEKMNILACGQTFSLTLIPSEFM